MQQLSIMHVERKKKKDIFTHYRRQCGFSISEEGSACRIKFKIYEKVSLKNIRSAKFVFINVSYKGLYHAFYQHIHISYTKTKTKDKIS